MSRELIPPGLTYLADNIISRQNILGVPKEQSARWAQGLNLPKRAETIFFAGCGYQFSSQMERLMSLLRRSDESPVGAELPVRLAAWQKKLGLDGISSRVLSRAVDTEAQPLEAAVKVLQNFGVQPGYLAEDEPCCGAPLYHIGRHQEFARNARQAYQKLKSCGVRRVISIVPSCTHAVSTLFPLYVDGFDLEAYQQEAESVRELICMSDER